MNNRLIKSQVSYWRVTALLVLVVVLTVTSTRQQADTGICDGGAAVTIPFTDVPSGNIFFCSIAAAYFEGLTNGTTPTTYSPAAPVQREQMAAFVTRTLDQSLRRGSQQAILNQWWIPTTFPDHAKSPVGTAPYFVAADGADLWVTNFVDGTITRVRASDGGIVQTWTGAVNPICLIAAQGAVFVTGNTSPGKLYTLVSAACCSNQVAALTTDQLGALPVGIAFDGTYIWTANQGGSVSRVSNGVPTTISLGVSSPYGMLYDGTNIWITDRSDNRLKELDSNANILASIPVGDDPFHPAFDGINIWVPNRVSNTVTVVRVKDAAGDSLASPFTLATLSGNGLSDPRCAAFDGQRILITNFGAESVSLWKAADLSPLGSVTTGTNTHPVGVCSDGANFWITLYGFGQLLRF
jgi:hypothetical protein